MLLCPSEFFARNGGAALLSANGYSGDAPLQKLLATSWPTWPKAESPDQPAAGAVEKLKTTRPGAAAVHCTILAWEGGLSIYSPAFLQAVPGVTVERGLSVARTYELAWNSLALPRPLLFLTVGPSYQPAIRSARLTLDPNLIEGAGQISFLLDRERVEVVTLCATYMKTTPFKLRSLKGSIEHAIAFEGRNARSTSHGKTFNHPRHPLLVKQVRKAQGLPAKANLNAFDEDFAQQREFWENVSRLPMSDDPSWGIAEAIQNPKKAS